MFSFLNPFVKSLELKAFELHLDFSFKSTVHIWMQNHPKTWHVTLCTLNSNTLTSQKLSYLGVIWWISCHNMLLSHSADDISVNFFFQFMTQRSKNGSWYDCLKYPSVLDNLVILLELPTPSDSLSSSTNKTNLTNVSSPSNENIYVGLSPHSNI